MECGLCEEFAHSIGPSDMRLSQWSRCPVDWLQLVYVLRGRIAPQRLLWSGSAACNRQ